LSQKNFSPIQSLGAPTQFEKTGLARISHSGEAVVGSWLAKHRSRRHECVKIRRAAKPGRE
jgi:hypothetical protein